LQQREVLRRQGRHIAVFRLRGFIFFGTAYSIFEAIRRRVEDAADLRPRFLVLDMCHVRGLDGSGELVFQRIARFAADRRIFLLLSSVDAQLREQLRRRGVVDGENPYLRTFGDLDHALEWAEDRILVSHGFPVRRRRRRIDEVLTGLLGDALQAERLFPYLKRHEVREGHKLVGEGEEVSGVYIVTLGEFAVFLEDAGRPPRRLRSMREGSVFGAAEAFLRVPLASTLVATSSSECYSIPVELVQSIGAAEPDLAPVLQDLIVRVLAERVIDTNRTVRVLSE
jgi:SulP family sulfate permease